MMPRWREDAKPRILLIDGAESSHEVAGEVMRSADVVACVPDDDTVNIVKDENGVARQVTPEAWLELIGSRLRHRRNGQVIQVDAADVGREAA